MSSYPGRTRTPQAEHRAFALVASLFLHLIALAWFVMKSAEAVELRTEPTPLLAIDLPLPVPETIEVLETPAISEVDRVQAATTGGDGGRPARALSKSPDVEPELANQPRPLVVLVPTVPLSIAPAIGPAVIGSSETATGKSAGVGEGFGSGDGVGIGSGSRPDTGGTSDPLILQPAQWIVRPTEKKLRSVYPFLAQQTALAGAVRLSCRVKGKRAKDCRVLSETPKGVGFGEAAIEAVRSGWIKAPITDARDPENVRVLVSMDFEWTE